MMFFVLKLNPLLFSQEILSESVSPDNVNSSILTFPTPTGTSKRRKGVPSVSYLNHQTAPLSIRVGTRFKTKTVLRWDRAAPLSWRLVGNQLYLFYQKMIVASDIDGTERWDFYTREESHLFPPSFSRQFVFVSSSSGQVYSLNRKTGTMKWFIDLDKPVLSSALLFNDKIYVVVGSSRRAQLVQIQPGSGKLGWLSKHEFRFSGHLMGSPSSLGYIIVGGDSEVLALNGHDGQLVWSAPNQGPLLHGAVTVVGQTIYLVNEQGLVLILEAKTGSKVREYNLGQKTMGPLTYVPKYEVMAFMGEDFHLHVIDRRSGKEQWKFKIGDKSPSKFVTSVRLDYRSINQLSLYWSQSGWSIWSPCGKRGLCIFNPKSGRILGRVYLQGAPSSQPYFDGSSFFLSLYQPTISKRDGTKETLPWAIVKMTKIKPKKAQFKHKPTPKSNSGLESNPQSKSSSESNSNPQSESSSESNSNF